MGCGWEGRLHNILSFPGGQYATHQTTKFNTTNYDQFLLFPSHTTAHHRQQVESYLLLGMIHAVRTHRNMDAAGCWVLVLGREPEARIAPERLINVSHRRVVQIDPTVPRLVTGSLPGICCVEWCGWGRLGGETPHHRKFPMCLMHNSPNHHIYHTPLPPVSLVPFPHNSSPSPAMFCFKTTPSSSGFYKVKDELCSGH